MTLQVYNILYDKYCKIDKRWRKTGGDRFNTGDKSLKKRRDALEKLLRETDLD